MLQQKRLQTFKARKSGQTWKSSELLCLTKLSVSGQITSWHTFALLQKIRVSLGYLTIMLSLTQQTNWNHYYSVTDVKRQKEIKFFPTKIYSWTAKISLQHNTHKYWHTLQKGNCRHNPTGLHTLHTHGSDYRADRSKPECICASHVLKNASFVCLFSAKCGKSITAWLSAVCINSALSLTILTPL